MSRSLWKKRWIEFTVPWTFGGRLSGVWAGEICWRRRRGAFCGRDMFRSHCWVKKSRREKIEIAESLRTRNFLAGVADPFAVARVTILTEIVQILITTLIRV